MSARGRAAGLAALAMAVASAWAAPAAADDLEPFERELTPPDDAPVLAEPPHADGFRPVSDVLLAGIRFYQTDIGPGSIRRCPFVVSCSNHARIAIERYGIFGLPLFLDRFFFRENPGTESAYGLARMPDGTLRLDDAAFNLD